MKKIGLYGGTFNPVHFGHLNLAFELMEKGGLDEVWWIPTSRSPLRPDVLEVSPDERFKMVKLVVDAIPEFKVLDNEIRRKPPAYTVDTVEEIIREHPDKKFYLLLGEDSLFRFMEWKEPERIIELVSLLIGGREGSKAFHLPDAIQADVQRGFLKTTKFEISATHIRERLKKRMYCGHLVPAKVLDFIYVNQLYFTV